MIKKFTVTKIFSLVLFIFLNSTFSQVEVSTRLQQAISQAQPDEYIRALVLLRDQVDVVSMDQKFYRENTSIQQRVYQLITALEEKARTTQFNILT